MLLYTCRKCFVVLCVYRAFLEQFPSLVRACIAKLQLIIKQYRDVISMMQSVSCCRLICSDKLMQK